MGIITSTVSTSTDGNLTINPDGTGKVKLTKLSGKGELPLGAKNADGEVSGFDHRELTELTDMNTGDLVMVQRGGDYYSTDASELGGAALANPSPGDVTFVPPVTGSGTQGDPYKLTAAISQTIGGSLVSVETCTVSNMKPDAFLPIYDESGAPATPRFTQAWKLAAADGTASFNFDYLDEPQTALGSGQVYKGVMKMGTGSVYVTWDVTQIANLTQFGPGNAPNSSPTTVDYAVDGKYGLGTSTWADGARTLVASDLVFSVNGGVLNGSQKTVADGDTVQIGYVDSEVAAAAEGATISGTLQSTDGAYYSVHEMIKDTVPAPFSIVPLTDQAASAVVTTGNNPLRAVNAPTEIAAPVAGANPLTSVEVSVNGGAFTSSYPVTFNPGDSLQAHGTTGAAGETAYTTTFNIGGTTAVFPVTTGELAPADLVQPQITNPPNLDGNEQAPGVAVTSTAAAYQDGAPIVHQESDWQAYKALVGAAPEFLDSDTITASPGADGTTEQTLTLASDEGFDNFQVGNRVEQDGAYTPTTSAIKTVVTVNKWTAAAIPGDGSWKDVTHGQTSVAGVAGPAGTNLFVGVASGGTNRVTFSTDGTNWNLASASVGSSNSWKGVTHGNGKFVAVADSGTNRVMYSTDGVNWTPAAAANEGGEWKSVTYGNGKFVAVANGGGTRVMYSDDGENWKNDDVTGVLNLKWTSVTYGNGKFVAVAEKGSLSVMYSTDGVNWTSAAAPKERKWMGVTYGNGKFVAIANEHDDVVMWADENFLDTWFLKKSGGNPLWAAITHGNSTFVGVAFGGSTTNSSMWADDNDLEKWNRVPTTASGWSAITYGQTGVAGAVGPAGTGVFVAIKPGGTKAVMWSQTGKGSSYTRLTLTDATDLKYMEVGDEVQPGIVIKRMDASEPSLTVTAGGSWTGSDGTSSGDAADRETKVTGPAKQGKGKLKSLNAAANQMTLQNVTSVWVANDNGGSGTGTPETFKVRDKNIKGIPIPPTTEPPNPANYTLHEESLNNTSDLTSWKPGSAYPRNSAIFTRVKHRDNNSNESDYSPWSGFEIR